MKKSDRKLLAETLDKALEPPPKRKPALASHLADYEEAPSSFGRDYPKRPPPLTPRHVGSPHPTPSTCTLLKGTLINALIALTGSRSLPAFFPAQARNCYDALYIRTRGAIVPAKGIRATKRELSDWSGIRNAKTIDAHFATSPPWD